MKRPVTREDLLSFRFLARPAISPDGTSIAYMVHRADRETNRYVSDLWLHDLASGTNRQLTASGREKFFCWNR